MADFGIGNSANNFGRSAGLQANTIANRPTQAAEGTIFIDVDTLIMYRYNALIEFPDWQIIGGGGSAFAGARNGVQLESDFVELGGSLLQNTTIDILQYNLFLNANNGWTFLLQNGAATLGLTTDEDGNNKYIDINNNAISHYVRNADNDNFVNIYHSYYYYAIVTSEYYADWDTLNEYNPLNINYNNSTQLNFAFFDNDNGNQYFSEFTLSNTMGAEGNFLARYNFSNMPVYTDNADAIANGLQIGDLYRHDNVGEAGDQLRIVH